MSDDIEARLRETLAERARRAPDGHPAAERIVAAAHRGVPAGRSRRRWRSWTLPLVSAAAVAAIAGTLVGVAQTRHTAAPRPQPAAPVRTPGLSSGPSGANPAPRPTDSTATATAAHRIGDLTNVRVRDLTFAGGGNAWALASARCGTGGDCTVVLHSADGGSSWTEAGPAPQGVEHVRFATGTVGYAYGPGVLYLTADGGRTWQRQDGGALALETLSGNVIRVSTNCLPGCPMTVQTSPIGGTSWTTTDIVQPGMSPGVALVRTGHAAYLAVFGHTFGGATDASTALYVSTDDGAHWTNRGEPCHQDLGGLGEGEIDTTRLAAAPDGSVTVLCTPRQAGGQGWQFTMTSTNAGRTFARGGVQALGSAPVSALAAASAKVILVASDETYRSVDGGRSFSQAVDVPGALRWLGFESATDGRAISADGRTIWTTRDAGATWSSYAFS